MEVRYNGFQRVRVNIEEAPLYNGVGAVCVGAFGIEPEALAAIVVRLVVANAPEGRRRAPSHLDVVAAVGNARGFIARLDAAGTATFGGMRVAVRWEHAAEAPVAAARLRQARVEISQRRIRRPDRTGYQGAALGSLLRWRHRGQARAESHVVTEQHALAPRPAPRLSPVEVLDLVDREPVHLGQAVTAISLFDEVCLTGAVRVRLRLRRCVRVSSRAADIVIRPDSVAVQVGVVLAELGQRDAAFLREQPKAVALGDLDVATGIPLVLVLVLLLVAERGRGVRDCHKVARGVDGNAQDSVRAAPVPAAAELGHRDVGNTAAASHTPGQGLER